MELFKFINNNPGSCLMFLLVLGYVFYEISWRAVYKIQQYIKKKKKKIIYLVSTNERIRKYFALRKWRWIVWNNGYEIGIEEELFFVKYFNAGCSYCEVHGLFCKSCPISIIHDSCFSLDSVYHFWEQSKDEINDINSGPLYRSKEMLNLIKSIPVRPNPKRPIKAYGVKSCKA